MPNVFPKPTDAMVYCTPDDLKRLMLTKNCGCFGSAMSCRNRSPIGKASASPVIPINLLTAPGLPASAGFTTIAIPCSPLIVRSCLSAASRHTGSSLNRVIVATPLTIFKI